MEITVEAIQKRFGELPEDLQWAIMAAKIDEHIMEIGKRHALNVEQMGELSLETHMVALGETHPDKFEDSVQKSMQMPEGKTRSVVEEVNNLIFKTFRKELMAYHARKTPEQEHEAGHKIMKSVGINLNPEPLNPIELPRTETLKMETAKMELPKPSDRAEMLKHIENPSTISNSISGFSIPKDSINPLAEQKFSGAFQIPRQETTYQEKKPLTPVAPKPAPPRDPNAPDPYREPVK